MSHPYTREGGSSPEGGHPLTKAQRMRTQCNKSAKCTADSITGDHKFGRSEPSAIDLLRYTNFTAPELFLELRNEMVSSAVRSCEVSSRSLGATRCEANDPSAGAEAGRFLTAC